MLITTCPECTARFRVTPQQLNAKQGQVRCGSCQQVFSGFQALERFPDDDTGGRLLARMESEAIQGDQGMAPSDLPEVGSADLPAGVAKADEALPRAAPSDPATGSMPRGLLPPPEESPAPGLLLEEPEPPAPASRAWRFAVVLLALVLLLELAYAYRGPLAQSYPVLRPVLEAACSHAGCAVPWARDPARLKLEDSEMLEVPGKPGEIALGARIRNLAAVAQDYPHLELTLTDLTGQAAARRVLRPADYLGRAPALGEVLAPGVEIALQMRLETPRIKATGYELLLFYP